MQCVLLPPFPTFLLLGAVSSHIINLFLLLLGHQIIIFKLLHCRLIIICWLCMLYLKAFQGKGFLTVKTNFSEINIYIASEVLMQPFLVSL